MHLLKYYPQIGDSPAPIILLFNPSYESQADLHQKISREGADVKIQEYVRIANVCDFLKMEEARGKDNQSSNRCHSGVNWLLDKIISMEMKEIWKNHQRKGRD